MDDPERLNIKAGPDEMKFRLVIKSKDRTLLDFKGFPRRKSLISMKDMASAIECERIIEHLTGLRVHLLQVIDE